MKINSRINHYFSFIAVLIIILFLAIRLIIVFSKSTDLAGIEQNVIYSIQTLIYSGKLYTSPSKLPFSITQYTPLYYYVCHYTALLINIDASDFKAIYTIGRLWNIVFNLITAFIIFRIGRKILLLSKNEALTLFILSFCMTFPHNFAVRPDSLHDMLGVVSFYFFIKYHSDNEMANHKKIYLFLAVLFTAFAVFSKQSGIQLIIIYGGFLLINKDWKNLAVLSFFCITIYGGFLILFSSLYSSFFENVIGGVANGINLTNFLKYVIGKNIFLLAVWPLILLFLYLVFKNNSIFKGDKINRLLALTILGTLIFASATALKMGSTVQYYILYINFSLPYVFHYLHLKRENNSDKKRITFLAFNSYAGLIVILFFASNIKLIRDFDYSDFLDKQRFAATETAKYIENNIDSNSSKYVFANLTTDSSIPSRQSINNILFKNCLVPEMDILEYSTGPSKVIGYSAIENMFVQNKVKFLIESEPKSKFRLLSNLESIKKSKYKLVKKVDGYLIYKLNTNRQ